MKAKFNKKTICLACLALALTLSLSIGGVMAYFTTYAVAKGGVALDLGFSETKIDEKVVNGQKELVLTNTGDFECYVRLKALTGDAYKDTITYSEPDGAGKWTPGADGFYYYSDIVAAKASTTQINVGFTLPVDGDPTDEEVPADFNVIIIQECTPVLYDENGNPYANWNVKADVSQTISK